MAALTPERPGKCLACGNEHILSHCPTSPTCTWVQCPACNAITAIIFGQVKAIAGRFK